MNHVLQPTLSQKRSPSLNFLARIARDSRLGTQSQELGGAGQPVRANAKPGES